MSETHPAEPDTLGQRLVKAREHVQMSAADLRRKLDARGISLSRARLWNYENRAESSPRPEVLSAIANITGVELHWLLTGLEAEPDQPETVDIDHAVKLLRSLDPPARKTVCDLIVLLSKS